MTVTRIPEVVPLHVAQLGVVSPLSPQAVARANGDAVEVLVDRTGLPVQRFGATADVVHVLLAEVNDLGPWLAELDGRLTVESTAAGLEEWTLCTELAATRRRGPVRVEAHALAMRGQFVLPSLSVAVNR